MKNNKCVVKYILKYKTVLLVMRVFYTEENEDKSKQYFIIIENIEIPDNLKGTKSFDANTIIELKSKVVAYYNFKLPATVELQLWSGPIGTTSIRLDRDINNLSSAYNTLWVRAANNITTSE